MRLRKRTPSGEADEAVKDAQLGFEKVQARAPEVHQLAGALRDIRRQNHFAEQLFTIMGGTK